MAGEQVSDVTASPVTAETSTPDYSTQPAQLTPPSAPAEQTPASPATAPASAVGATPGVHGVLGSIVVGALEGAAKKMATGVGNRLKNFAQNSPYGQELQKNAQARAAASQEMQLKQNQESRAQQTAGQEAQKSVDAHTEAVLRTNAMTQDNIHKVIENQHIEELYPGEEESQRNTLKDQHRAQSAADRDLLSTLEASGVHIDVGHGAGHDSLTQDHARDVALGKTTMISNGKEGKDAGYGVLDNTELQNTPLSADAKVVSDWNLDPKTGKMTPIYKTLTAGHNTAFDALIAHDAASKKFQTLQDQYSKQLADTKSKAEGFKAEEEGVKAGAEAKQMGAGITDANRALTGDAFVSTLPGGMQDGVKGLLNYQVQPNDLGRGKEKMPLVEAAVHADSTWSPAKYNERYHYIQEYGSSSKGDGATRNRLNTAIGHTDMLAQAGQALTQTNLPKLNEIANALGVATGKDPKVVYDAIASKAAGEIAGAIKGGGAAATDPEIENARKGFDSSLSPDQRNGNIRAQMGLLKTQVGTIAGKFQSTMGKSPDDYGQPVLYGNAQQLLDKWTGGGKSVSVGGQQYPLNPDGTFTVNGHNYKTSPDGKTAVLVQGK